MISNSILKHLKENNIEFNCNSNISDYISFHEHQEHLAEIEENVKRLMSSLLIDQENDHNSKETAHRVAKMLYNELLVGRYTPPPKVTVFPNTKNLDELVYTRCDVKSLCSHHLLPIVGQCHIGILYDQEVMGLSKFNRIVSWFSRRGQIQEELVVQIADFIEQLVKPKALGVVIKATHYCAKIRGVNQEGSMITSVMRGGLMEQPSLKEEFLSFIKFNSNK
jgi:GTP cyclohydrolase I